MTLSKHLGEKSGSERERDRSNPVSLLFLNIKVPQGLGIFLEVHGLLLTTSIFGLYLL